MSFASNASFALRTTSTFSCDIARPVSRALRSKAGRLWAVKSKSGLPPLRLLALRGKRPIAEVAETSFATPNLSPGSAFQRVGPHGGLALLGPAWVFGRRVPSAPSRPHQGKRPFVCRGCAERADQQDLSYHGAIPPPPPWHGHRDRHHRVRQSGYRDRPAAVLSTHAQL